MINNFNYSILVFIYLMIKNHNWSGEKRKPSDLPMPTRFRIRSRHRFLIFTSLQLLIPTPIPFLVKTSPFSEFIQYAVAPFIHSLTQHPYPNKSLLCTFSAQFPHTITICLIDDCLLPNFPVATVCGDQRVAMKTVG